MNLELVGQWKTVMFRSSASLFGLAAAILGVLGQIDPYLPMLQSLVSPQVFKLLSIACAIGVPIARVFKQDQLRLLTAATNPQPVTPAEPQ